MAPEAIIKRPMVTALPIEGNSNCRARLLCHILEHMSYPTELHLECRHHSREHFTLDQWTQLAGKNPMESTPEVDQAQQDERPADSIPSTPVTPSMPQVTSTDPPATPPIPSVAPSTSEDFITVSSTEFRAMIQFFKTLTATHNALFWLMANIRAQQDQHTAILH
uniref:Uncharacterized protein n=1 Tax=Vitis vinifera TaxID=29760 RepID=A5AHE1_VITVI|nr:hypothetical protein VITISV_033258 [Vitis vinifera]